MKIEKNDIAMCILSITIPLVFIIGMVKWPDFPKDGTWKGNLYYVCTAGTLYMMSVVAFIAAKTRLWKIGSCFGIAIFGVNLYVELYLDPTHWTNWNMALVLVVSFNTLLTVFIIEKLKSKWGKQKSYYRS